MMAPTTLFGGTFDPVHNGHLDIARAAAARFHLNKVLFIPAANPPHKSGAHASFDDRVRMLELAVTEDPRFEVSRIEEGGERSYSILTIEKLLPRAGRLGFLIGADAFAEIETWRRWQDVVASVEFIVVTRPGATYRKPPGSTVHELNGIEIPVSSSEIRARLERGDFDVPVPPAVVRYIRERGLYTSTQ
jgi:nicotinate-nucleotide adenylyltransferase